MSDESAALGRVPVCTDEVCITCGDVAVPVRVLRLLPGELAIVDADGHEEEISVALVAADVGATVLVHAGEAIATVSGDGGAVP